MSDAESEVLACCLLSEDAVQQATSSLTKGCFTNEDNGLIFEAISKLYADVRPVTTTTVNAALGGKHGARLVELVALMPATASIQSYIKRMLSGGTGESSFSHFEPIWHCLDCGGRIPESVFDGHNGVCADCPPLPEPSEEQRESLT